MQEKLHEALRLFKAGNRYTSARILTELLEYEPDNEYAWLLLADVVGDQEKKRICLERILKINPTNLIARHTLHKMDVGNANKPNQMGLTDIADPELITFEGGTYNPWTKSLPYIVRTQNSFTPTLTPPTREQLNSFIAGNENEEPQAESHSPGGHHVEQQGISRFEIQQELTIDSDQPQQNSDHEEQTNINRTWSNPHGRFSQLVVLVQNTVLAGKPGHETLDDLVSVFKSGGMQLNSRFPEKIIPFEDIRMVSGSSRSRCLTIQHTRDGRIQEQKLDFSTGQQRDEFIETLGSMAGEKFTRHEKKSNHLQVGLVPVVAIILIAMYTLIMNIYGWGESPILAFASTGTGIDSNVLEQGWIFDWLGFSLLLTLSSLLISLALVWLYGCFFGHQQDLQLVATDFASPED